MAAKVPLSPAAVGGIAQVLIGGGLAVYGLTNSLFNVEGGHRAIVFNRLVGIKEEVSSCSVVIFCQSVFRKTLLAPKAGVLRLSPHQNLLECQQQQ
jgi:prohibitin 2